MATKKIPRPVIRARRPASLYRTDGGEAVYEFEIPGYAAMPTVYGLIRLRRNANGEATFQLDRIEGELRIDPPCLDRDVAPVEAHS